MKILLTGHKGFIGSHYHNLIKENNEVFAVDKILGDDLCDKSITKNLPDVDVVIHMAATNGTNVFDLAETPSDVGRAGADVMLGMKLRAYKFDLYKTKKKDDDKATSKAVGKSQIAIALSDPASAKREAKRAEALADGITLARNLVNEPPNVLFPASFAQRAKELQKLGVEVQVLD